MSRTTLVLRFTRTTCPPIRTCAQSAGGGGSRRSSSSGQSCGRFWSPKRERATPHELLFQTRWQPISLGKPWRKITLVVVVITAHNLTVVMLIELFTPGRRLRAFRVPCRARFRDPGPVPNCWRARVPRTRRQPSILSVAWSPASPNVSDFEASWKLNATTSYDQQRCVVLSTPLLIVMSFSLGQTQTLAWLLFLGRRRKNRIDALE